MSSVLSSIPAGDYTRVDSQTMTLVVLLEKTDFDKNTKKVTLQWVADGAEGDLNMGSPP